MTLIGHFATDQYDSDPDDYERDDEQDREAPLFGCACENPLSVDTVCEACIAWMKEQELNGPVTR